MKRINRIIAILILCFSSVVFAEENWRHSGSFLLPNTPVGALELGTNLRIRTIQNTNPQNNVLRNVVLAYTEASTDPAVAQKRIRIHRLEGYNGGGVFPFFSDSWLSMGNPGYTNRGFSFNGYADLGDYNYEIAGTSLTSPILGCLNAPCSGYSTLGDTSAIVPQIATTSHYPASKSSTDMISDYASDYFAYPDQTQEGRVTVVKRIHNHVQSAGVWEAVGQPGFSAPGTVAHVRLAFRSGYPLRIVVGTENGFLSSFEVFRLQPLSIPGQPTYYFWVKEGNSIPAQHAISTLSSSDPNSKYYAHPDLEINGAGVPFLLTSRKTTSSEGGKIQSTVRRLSGNQWVPLGNEFIGNSSSMDNVCTDMTFNTFNDRLYVGCIEFFNLKPVVKTYLSGLGLWTNAGNVYDETGYNACVPFGPPPDSSITHDRATNALFFAFSGCGNGSGNDPRVVVVSKDLD
ncbi:hypothetical protein CH379_013715 [Leptospira ellisii]|uniref:Uncharacterized protein n=1 Tax=Leptospira ellisii TaxID=2023197 RepID=A0A2N0B950_9LEPT|nr:hypothetical protein [Leptospira ellisii]MDV6236683.1 hypothetical protein [Leptospira ellisii]PJZ93067.1 hypothetical protein CH379_09845 [Leptospira ellisii]PKA03760.1 hypothetical protein CH375_15085 [Leptospira ellisii]